MSAVTSASSQGMTDLIQILTSSSSPLAASGMSTSQIQSLVQNSSPGDIVKLSDQALKYQEVGALFADSSTATDAPTSATTFDSLMASLSLTGTKVNTLA